MVREEVVDLAATGHALNHTRALSRPAAKLRDHGQQLSICFELRHESIDKGQRLGWYVAT